MTFDELAETSRAFGVFVDQLSRADSSADLAEMTADALSDGRYGGALAFDLTAIHEAALEDPACEHLFQRGQSEASRRWYTPNRYLNGWADDEPREVVDGRVMVDQHVAFEYLMRRDDRVIDAMVENRRAARKAACEVDPIGFAVRSAASGGFGMMFARLGARDLGLDDQEWADAVMARAKEEAAGLGDYQAEELLSRVRRALEEGPRTTLEEAR